MNYVSALAIVLGIASGLISIYEFIKKGSWKPGIAFSVAAVVLLIAAIIVANLPLPFGSQTSGVSTVLNSSTPQSGTHVTSIPVTSTPTSIPTAMPTDTPTPLPYSVSKTGDTCKPSYSQFQGSGWVPEKNSFVFTGNGSNVVLSPCNITTPNYSVMATITLFNGQLGVGVIAHAASGGQTGYAGGSGCRNISFGRCGFFINDRFSDIMDIDQENENLSGQTHAYKLVVNEVMLQLFYDNSTIPIVSKSLATHPQAGYAGFECYAQCQVTGYTVTGI